MLIFPSETPKIIDQLAGNLKQTWNELVQIFGAVPLPSERIMLQNCANIIHGGSPGNFTHRNNFANEKSFVFGYVLSIWSRQSTECNLASSRARAQPYTFCKQRKPIFLGSRQESAAIYLSSRAPFLITLTQALLLSDRCAVGRARVRQAEHVPATHAPVVPAAGAPRERDRGLGPAGDAGQAADNQLLPAHPLRGQERPRGRFDGPVHTGGPTRGLPWPPGESSGAARAGPAASPARGARTEGRPAGPGAGADGDRQSSLSVRPELAAGPALAAAAFRRVWQVPLAEARPRLPACTDDVRVRAPRASGGLAVESTFGAVTVVGRTGSAAVARIAAEPARVPRATRDSRTDGGARQSRAGAGARAAGEPPGAAARS